MIVLSPKRSFRVPVYADCISPDVFSSKSLEELSMLQVWEGNKKRVLKDLFDVQGQTGNPAEEITLHIRGNLSKVRRIGAGMSRGRILIEGDVGVRLGEMMKGGEVTVKGNADSWVGCMMEGGTIEVVGSAGDYIGASYRGSTQGMKGGTIVIHGDAGSEVGCHMRGGLIKVDGNIGQFAGIHMRDGTISVQGNCDERAGAEMLNGKIIVCGYVPSILPSFAIEDIRPSVKIDGEKVTGPFYCFTGDIADNGNGRLFVSKPKNSHLSFYEKYL